MLGRLRFLGKTLVAAASTEPAVDVAAGLGALARLDLRVGKVIAAERLVGSDKLLVETVDFGEPTPRTVISGLAAFVAPESLAGTFVLGVCNMKPAKLAGVVSGAMLLCASSADRQVVDVIFAPPGSVAGERVTSTALVFRPDVLVKKSALVAAGCSRLAIVDSTLVVRGPDGVVAPVCSSRGALSVCTITHSETVS